MKKLCINVFTLILLCAPGRASLGQVSPPTALMVYSPVLSWCPSVNAAKYRIYMGTSSGVYTVTKDTSDSIPVYTFQTLTPGTYYFVVGALDQSGNESPSKSNEVAITFAPPPSIGPSITSISVSYITNTSAIISWVTNSDCEGTAFYGLSVSTLKSIKANNLGTTDHLVVVSPLVSKTHYVFKVSSNCNGNNLVSDLRSFNTK